jgi:hypothetical protein
MPLSPEDEITGSEEIINYGDIIARIAMLRPWHVEDTLIPESAIADPSIASYVTREEAEAHVAAHGPGVQTELEVVEWRDESEELAALRNLEAEMRSLNEASGRASAINEDYMDAFVRDELESAYGSDAVDGLDSWLKWDEIRAAKEEGMSQTTYRGRTYYLTP